MREIWSAAGLAAAMLAMAACGSSAGSSSSPLRRGIKYGRELIGEHADEHDGPRDDRADQLGKRLDTGDQLRATVSVPYAPKSAQTSQFCASAAGPRAERNPRTEWRISRVGDRRAITV